MMNAALALALRGFAVFPLRPGGKQPIHKGGFKDATVNPEQISAWWYADPDANIGIYPAACNPPQLVMDVEGADGTHKHDGFAALETLETLGVAPSTLTVRTPSGGFHLYYALPDKIAVKSSAGVDQGIDVRSTGGYVVGPGSVLEDGRTWSYIECGYDRPVLAPPELIAMCGRPGERSENSKEWLVDADLPANLDRAQKFLEGTEPAIEGEGGNDWTYKTAGMVRDFGVSEDGCVALLLAHWNDRCEPPWDADELGIVVENAYRYADRPAGMKSGEDHNVVFATLIAAVAEVGAGLLTDADSLSRVSIDSANHAIRLPQLVKKLITESTISLMVGEYDRYKSFLAITLNLHLALGREFAGLKVPEPVDILYVAGEAPDTIAERAKAWCMAESIGAPVRFQIVDGRVNFYDASEVEKFARFLQREQATGFKPKLIVLDTLATSAVGADENSATDMGIIFEHMRVLSRDFDCAFLIVHHLGKNKASGARGSSVIEAGADTILEVDADTDAMIAEIRVKKQKRGARLPAPLGFRGVVIKLWEDEDGDEVTSLAFKYDPEARLDNLSYDKFEDNRRRKAMQDVLRELPKGESMSVRALLANIMAHKLKPLDGINADKIHPDRDAITQWLKKRADGKVDDPAFDRYVEPKAGGGEVYRWVEPTDEKEVPDE